MKISNLVIEINESGKHCPTDLLRDRLLACVVTVLFFGFHQMGVAFAEILVLWAAIAGTVWAFFRASIAAGWLMVPYLGWVTFAALLNFSVWRLNA